MTFKTAHSYFYLKHRAKLKVCIYLSVFVADSMILCMQRLLLVTFNVEQHL